MKAKKLAVLDRYGKLYVVELGGAPEQHTHTWDDITGEKPLVFGDADGEAGKFDRLTDPPTDETPLRYNGVLRATKLFGVYFSDNSDLAERYTVKGPWEPGDLIQICPDGSLRRNEESFNRRVIGFVSTDPGMVLGQKTEGAPIALAGRVPVWVDGAVLPGEYLAASPIAGHVWKVDLEEAPRGSIVAMALESKTTMEPGLVMALVLRM